MKRKYTTGETVATIVFFGLIIFGIVSVCLIQKDIKPIDTKSSYDYAKEGYRKQQNGEPLSRNEREALESYNKWEEKQRDK